MGTSGFFRTHRDGTRVARVAAPHVLEKIEVDHVWPILAVEQVELLAATTIEVDLVRALLYPRRQSSPNVPINVTDEGAVLARSIVCMPDGVVGSFDRRLKQSALAPLPLALGDVGVVIGVRAAARGSAITTGNRSHRIGKRFPRRARVLPELRS